MNCNKDAKDVGSLHVQKPGNAEEVPENAIVAEGEDNGEDEEDVMDNEEDISVDELSEDGSRTEGDFSCNSAFETKTTSASKLEMPRPLIPLPNTSAMSPSPDIIAGIAQAMAVAAAAANTRYSSFSPPVPPTTNPLQSLQPGKNSIWTPTTNAGSKAPPLPTGFPMPFPGIRHPFMGK